MRVLGRSAACRQVASQLDYDLDETPQDGEEYVVVLEGDDALSRYDELTGQGVAPVAIVAWGVPSAALLYLASVSPAPVIIGCPDIWRLQSAIGGEDAQDRMAHLEKLARLEARLAEPGRFGGHGALVA